MVMSILSYCHYFHFGWRDRPCGRRRPTVPKLLSIIVNAWAKVLLLAESVNTVFHFIFIVGIVVDYALCKYRVLKVLSSNDAYIVNVLFTWKFTSVKLLRGISKYSWCLL